MVEDDQLESCQPEGEGSDLHTQRVSGGELSGGQRVMDPPEDRAVIRIRTKK